MKTIADFPASTIVDLESEVIELSRDDLNPETTGMKFCVAKETARHGTLYPEVRPYCVAYYAEDRNADPVEAEAKEKARGFPLYWINNCASSLTAHSRAKVIRILLKPGQKILMNGVLLEVTDKGFGHFGLVEA
ncbi:hypothetical protein D3C76_882550 [compost metagenome]